VIAVSEPNIKSVTEGWIRTTLGDSKFFDLIMGQSPLSETYTNKKTGLPFLQGNADFGVIYPNPKTYCTEPIKVAEKDDVLISVRAPVGEVNIATERYCIGRGLGAIRPRDKNNSKYLYFYLNYYRRDLEKISAGSTFKAITKDDLEKFPVILPPNEEKLKIISILSTVDNAIQRSQQAIAETERLKVGVMQELMTKGIGHTEFKEDPDVGRVPKEWEVVTLGDICLSNAFGPRFSATLYNPQGNVAILRTTDLDQDGNISYDQMPRAKLDLNEFKEHILLSNDLVITRSGTCGIGAIFSDYKIPVLPGAFLIRFRLSPEINAQFLKQYINSSIGREEITRLECGGVQKNLKGSALLKIKIPRPSPKEQEHIISVLSTIDTKLLLQRKRTSLLEQLKQGLMNDLLTGKRRVKVT
jgi:type I restriction enzyme S subunit